MGRDEDAGNGLFIPEASSLSPSQMKRRKILPFKDDTDSDSDRDSNEDANQSNQSAEQDFCICHGPEDGFMIACDGCDRWFHGTCVRLRKSDEHRVDKFFCPGCEEDGKGKTIWKDRASQGISRKGIAKKLPARKLSLVTQRQEDAELLTSREGLTVHERKKLYLRQLKEGIPASPRSPKVLPSPKKFPSTKLPAPTFKQATREEEEEEEEGEEVPRPAKRARLTVDAPPTRSANAIVSKVTAQSPRPAETISGALDESRTDETHNDGWTTAVLEKYDKPPSLTDRLVKDAMTAALFGKHRLMDSPGRTLEAKAAAWKKLQRDE